MKRNAATIAIIVLLSQLAFLNAQIGRNPTWGDQGNGTYKNPILKSDYSDPDILRHGDDFYLIASDFHFVGMQVLHSKDLVNWKIIGQVFDRLDMAPKYDEMKGYSEGTWAPALRYHDGEFYIYVCTPQDGLFMWHAKSPAGPWSKTVTVKAVPLWEDPCPFWDDDGQAYLIHSYKGAGPLILHRMSPDGTQLLDEGKEIYRGPTAEGPKIYNRKGYYYISLPEGGVDGGWQTVLRAKNIYGPYERRQVFPKGSPHQGGWVELPNGETWFISFKSTGYLGRICYLNPIRWTDDDWPVFGDNGQPVDTWKKPDVGKTYPVSRHQTSDEFSSKTLSPIWQWNHNPVPDAWSLTSRPGWLRLTAQPAATLNAARNTLTQKIWDSAGIVDVKIDISLMKNGQRAGFAFMSGSDFGWIGVGQEKGIRRIMWDQGEGPVLKGSNIWLRGINNGDEGLLLYSPDGKTYRDTGKPFRLFFRYWKGSRIALFSFGANSGSADFDYVHYRYGATTEALGIKDISATPSAPEAATPAIDRKAWVTRHNPKLNKLDPDAPLTVGNGGFAFTADITGLQTFAEHYYKNGIPLETLSRKIWHSQPNPNNYKLEDTNQNYQLPDGRTLALPTRQASPAGDWLRKNPHAYPLGQLGLEWLKPDGTTLIPEDIQNPEQTLDMWRGVVTSRFRLAGTPVTVITVCAPDSDTIGVRINSPLIREGKLRARLAFPRGYDMNVKNTPPFDWSSPEAHVSTLIDRGASGALIRRKIDDTRYSVIVSTQVARASAHMFTIAGDGSGETLEFSVQFQAGDGPFPATLASYGKLLVDSAAQWEKFWNKGAAVDFSGSTNPLALKLEERIVLSQYLMAVQMAGAVPPQESGLTCSTWYGKHHTEMIWWHTAQFALWGHDDLLIKNLEWYQARLPEAQALAASRDLDGARWSKMVGLDGRESPGGNPLIIWNQPHLIYLCELLYRNRPSPETLARYRDLVLKTAECMASMVLFDEKLDRYVLGPPLWIAQEIYDPAKSQNPGFELSYWRWALGIAQQWRERLKIRLEPKWDDVIARLSELPVKDGKYVALESNPDTWDNINSRHDHPSMLMPLGFLPGGPDVDRATMGRTLDAVLKTWDWESKIWGWDYPMIAMTAARLGKPEIAMEVLLREGPNNHYYPSGHCPQGSDRIGNAGGGRREIASYLPANGAFLSAVALMVAGWDGCKETYPGIPKDGTWKVRAEGLRRLP